MTHPAVSELLGRANRLGADRKNTNYAGGNASAKAVDTDPVTGRDVELMWVKGSDGDLGTLTEAGLAVLRLDWMRLDGYQPLPEAERRAKAAALAPTIRGIASHDTPLVGHFTDDPAVLEFLSRAEHPRLAALGTSCPDHFLRTKVKPMLLDLPATAPVEQCVARLHELHQPYRDEYRTYYDVRRGRLAGDARCRPADRARPWCRHVQLWPRQADRPRRRRVLPERDQRDARRGSAFDVPADQ